MSNVRMPKIMCKPIKVGICKYTTYANCRTLQCQQSNKIYKHFGMVKDKSKYISQIVETAKSSPHSKHLLE